MNIVDRLSNQLVETPTGCWEYIGALNADGYGVISFLGRQRRIHRLIWELEFGPIPKGILVCHFCDNRKCGNPSHLFLGTHQDNVDDMVAKGRDSFGHNKGSNNGQAILLEDDVRQIKRLLQVGHLTQTAIAQQFMISRRTVGFIKSGERWGWLQ